MIVDITPTEIAGQHWVNVIMDGGELRRHGPFSTLAAAEDMAARFAAVCRTLQAEVHMRAAAHTR